MPGGTLNSDYSLSSYLLVINDKKKMKNDQIEGCVIIIHDMDCYWAT